MPQDAAMDDTHQFLQFLFGDKPDDAQIVLCWPVKNTAGTLTMRAQAFTSLDEAGARAVHLKEQFDVYVGVGLQRGRTIHSRGRGEAQDIIGLIGLWADLDIGRVGHTKANLLPTREVALAFLHELPFQPSLVLWSGHGVHSWWAFREPWIFDDRSEWARAELLTTHWEAYLHAVLQQRGWVMDSVCDLARVLRVAGTLNHKDSPPTSTVIIEALDALRYNPSEIEAFLLDQQGLVDTSRKHAAPPVVTIGEIVEDPAANPPFDKLEAMLAVIPRTRACWEKRLKDLAEDSMSTHNMSLAVYAMTLGWSNQEVVDLVIAHRRKHGVDLKIGQTWERGTMSWYRNLLLKAHAYLAQRRADEAIDEHLMEEPNGQPRIMGEDRRRILRESLAKLWEFSITQCKQFSGDPPRWGIETPLGGAMFTADDIMSQRRFRSRIMEATGRIIKKVKDDRWDAHAQAFIDAAEPVETGPESETSGLMRSWLSRYVERRKLIDVQGKEVQSALLRRDPFQCNYDGLGSKTYIFALEFRKWISENVGAVITERQMGIALTQFGARPKTMKYTETGQNSSRYVWGLPESWNV